MNILKNKKHNKKRPQKKTDDQKYPSLRRDKKIVLIRQVRQELPPRKKYKKSSKKTKVQNHNLCNVHWKTNQNRNGKFAGSTGEEHELPPFTATFVLTLVSWREVFRKEKFLLKFYKIRLTVCFEELVEVILCTSLFSPFLLGLGFRVLGFGVFRV